MLVKRNEILSNLRPYRRDQLSTDSGRITFNIASKNKSNYRIKDRTLRILHQLNKLNRNRYDKNPSDSFNVIDNPFNRGIASFFLLAKKLFVRAQHTYETWKNLPLSKEENLIRITQEEIDQVKNKNSAQLSPKQKLILVCQHYISRQKYFNIPHFNTAEFAKDLNIVFYIFAMYLYKENCLRDTNHCVLYLNDGIVMTYSSKMEAIDRKPPANYGSMAWHVLSVVLSSRVSYFTFNVYHLRNVINACNNPDFNPVQETLNARDKMTPEKKLASLRFSHERFESIDTNNVMKFYETISYNPIEVLLKKIRGGRNTKTNLAPSKKISID